MMNWRKNIPWFLLLTILVAVFGIAHSVKALSGEMMRTAEQDNQLKPAVPSSYLVYAMPVESPHFTVPLPPADARTTEISPWLNAPTASPLGWHATSTISWTNTQGNNVDSRKGPTRFDCGPSLECDPPLDLTMEPTTPDNLNAALVNLFYWNNIIHDVTYEYGFDEAAGNFQNDNFGLGGLGNDRVNANAQGNGTCGAGFAVPPDGSSPTMNILICNIASPARDGALDNGVVAHEYGHGLSVRLTGGPANSSCLSNAEQMGEGWADWLGLMLTIEPGDTGTDLRTIGTWLFGQGPDGPGIRNFPYTTDFNSNPHTYNDIIGTSSPHAVGEVWATMLWDMVWALIDQYGYNPDFYGDWTTGGNNLAFQLVIDGMKLQPCSPGFVDGRDAILLADQALSGGQNQCLIWEAFANRGLGFSASQGSPNSTSDGTEAFDMPSFCSLLNVDPASLDICAGGVAEYEVTVGNGFTPDVFFTLEGHPPGTTATFSPNPVTAVPNTTTLTIDNTGSLLFASYDITITGTDILSTTDNQVVSLTVYDTAPGIVSLTSPPDEAINVVLQPQFVWTSPNLTTSFLLEVDDSLDFGSLVYSATLAESSHVPSITFEYDTTFYWRVTAENICGTGPASAVFSFTTQAEDIGLLERTPDLIEATLLMGDITTHTLTVSNVGTLPFDFTAATGAAWVEVMPSGGTLTQTQSMELAVVFDSNITAGIGTYTTTLTFSGSYGNDPAPVILVLHVVSEQKKIYMPAVFGKNGS
jgi:hypothetical protein